MALVTVWIQGEPWVVVDIGLRMLTPPELYGCQGLADNKCSSIYGLCDTGEE